MAGAKKRRSDVKRQPQPPARLPAEYREVWLALHDAQRSSPSRQALARRLGISTATLQRLLVRGDVPPFPSTRSVRVRRAWARTLGRLAMRLGHDPAAWIEKVGIPAGDAQPALARLSSRRAAAHAAQAETTAAQARPVPLPPGATIAAAILRRGISASVPGAAAIDEFLEAFLRRLLGAADPSSTVEIHRVTESEARENLLGSASAAAILCGVVPRAEIARAGGWMLRIPGIRLTSGALRLADRSKPAAAVAPASLREALASRASESPLFLVAGSGPARAFLAGAAGIPEERILVRQAAEDPAGLADALLRESERRPERAVVLFGERIAVSATREALLRQPGLPDSIEIVDLAKRIDEAPHFPLAIAVRWEDAALARLLRQARDLDLFGAGAYETGRLYGRLIGRAAVVADPPLRLLRFDRAGARFRDGFRAGLAASLDHSGRLDVALSSRLAPSAWIAGAVAVPTASSTSEGQSAGEQGGIRRLAHCQSCAASLREEHNQGPSDRYCRWCSDEAGRLRPRAEVTRILAGWLQHWQEGLSADQALRRAESYMKLMPAWSEN